ncbi:XrtA/PEP-CTERM system exopolysaccharide export protein [Hahella ganghwensis]|uniref:XrtA/PEP-CTERM system exopolysaccharide export protein n=1 Tax=Hahella ganghwensis TaxID=286420 RepID=UPI0003775FDF|nr:XrtA/PEP-CTERM system exopolysaccharide export protein [Hahella ganghwensis]
MNISTFKKAIKLSILPLAAAVAACSVAPPLPMATLKPSTTVNPQQYKYLIGPNDELNVFVWGNPEISGSFTVRPDGMITTSLVEDIPVSGKTPTQVAREFEKVLATYIRDPIVSVSVTDFTGPFSEQIRVIGEAANPKALPYIEDMTLLDVMIQVNGLTDFADGNRATLARIEDGQYREYGLKIDDLIKDGNVAANVDLLPGDIVIIPEAWF